MQRLPQAKGLFSSEDMVMVLESLRWHVTTAQDGLDWMICNQLDIVIALSSMVIKFMSLEEVEQSKS